MPDLARDAIAYAIYFAPRGKLRLQNLGHQIAQRHLSPQDKLIGVVGDSGAGKSLLIKGIFPGMELTNDDEGVNIRPLPLLKNIDNCFFDRHTYHVDIRFESAFTQMHVLVDAIKKAIEKGKRVVVEHFELIYPFLGINAEILVGIGEEVIVTRPNLFGPLPKEVADIVHKSLRYRRMAHSAEDLSYRAILSNYNIKYATHNNDVKHGFVIEFYEKPDIDLDFLEKIVLKDIEDELDISYFDEGHIRIGENLCLVLDQEFILKTLLKLKILGL